MDKKQQRRISKFLSLILRHKPETVNLTLDPNGWADVAELLKKLRDKGFQITFPELQEVVVNNEKKRFAFSPDMAAIRANQGHSLTVDLGLIESTPPEVLYHGTADKNILSIKEQGIVKGQRQQVHLSLDKATAKEVGQRHGKPVVLGVKSGEMFRQGNKFYLSANGVWLTDFVPPGYIEFPS